MTRVRTAMRGTSAQMQSAGGSAHPSQRMTRRLRMAFGSLGTSEEYRPSSAGATSRARREWGNIRAVMSTARRTVSANGLRFALLEEGTGPLVLLLHGFPDTAHTWDGVRPALARAGFHAVSPYMRGYAPTTIPSKPAYDADTLGRDVLGLIDALGKKRAIVVGHDWGAVAAYSAAALGRERIALLVTVAVPHPAAVRPTPRLVWHARHFLSFQRKGAAAKLRANDFAEVDALVRRWSPDWDFPPTETAAVKTAFREPGSLEAALGYYRAYGIRLPPSLRKPIAVDTVCFAPTHDLFDRQPYDRAKRSFTGGYVVVRLPGGHFTHRERPEPFMEALLRVLKPPRVASKR